MGRQILNITQRHGGTQ